MRPDDWRRKGKYLDLNGHKVFCVREEGEGTPLLCLHGFPTSSFDYRKVWQGLSEISPLIAFDMIGYGFSDKPSKFPYTTKDQADILEAVLEELGIGTVHVISHDYGNTLMQEILARRKERGLRFRIKSLCYLNGALFPETHRPILAQKILISPIGPLFGRLIPAAGFAASLASVFGPDTQPTARELDDFIEIFRFNGGKRIAHKLIRYMRERAVHRERWLDALRSVDLPFRFINGLEDRVSGRHLVKRFRELLPELRDIVELEGVGHYPHFEVPDRFLNQYRNFRENFWQNS